ncbi:hypothetical protein QJQ45_011266 [Haematococcus lacustris]|nr:hypothetical protein QJQ45_011266 [Haematococcus lacustris]
MADGAKELIGDIVAGIVGNLPLKDVLRCSQVCRAWRDACKDRRTPALPPAQCSACSPSSSRGLGVPLHMGAVKLYEHSRLPGSGQVDTPNSYSGFRVGPVLLGCFMLPRCPLPFGRSAEPEAAEPEAAEHTKGKGKAAKAKPAPQPGRWLDRDCNAALNMQRIGESRWRPLELCYWPEQGALPAKGKEYPGLGYKRLRDKPAKGQQQQAPPI